MHPNRITVEFKGDGQTTCKQTKTRDSRPPVQFMVRGFGHDDNLSHRRSLPRHSIRIAAGDPVYQVAVGSRRRSSVSQSAGVGCQCWHRQASDCLHRPSRPRTNQTVTSNANPRKQRSRDIQRAPFGHTNQQHGHQQGKLITRTSAVTEDGRLIFHFKNRAGRPSVHGIVTRCHRLEDVPVQ